MCGVSKAAITKAADTGSIGMVVDGKKQVVNLDHHLTKEYMNSKGIVGTKDGLKLATGQPQRGKTVGKKPLAKEDPLVITAPISNAHGLPVIKSLDDIDETNLFLLEKRDIDKLKAYEQALETRLKREERRGLLIPRNTVKLIFSKIYTVDNNELKTMEDRLSPAICGIFGEGDDSENSVKVRKLLNDEITKALHHIKRIINDYLVKVGSEKI